MPRLTAKEIDANYNPIRDWEDAYGVDYPCCYVPYWVGYMPKDERIRYLAECKGEFVD